MKKVLSTLLLFGLMISCSGIILKPLRTIENNVIPEGLSEKKIIRSIKKAGATHGWLISTTKESKYLKATIQVRTHYVEVGISYTKTDYKISYRKSRNMKYSSENNMIHRTYYRWVENLRKSINQELAYSAVD